MNGIFVLVPIMVLGIAVAWIVSSSILKIQRLRLPTFALPTRLAAAIGLLALFATAARAQAGGREL